jgi:hypothetical protein
MEDEYVKMGKQWLNDEIVIKEFNSFKLNPKQIEFVNSKDRYTLFAGGMASGKTAGFIIKMILLSLFFPGNRILLGRKSRSEVERTVLNDFFDICPQGIYEYKVGPGIIKFYNGSEIIIFGLDALQSGNGQDTKKAEQAIKGLNLGGYFIDQLEEIEQRVFEALQARMRRNVPFQQSCSTINPANHWSKDFFIDHPRDGTKVIFTSMLDNKANLGEDYIKDQLSKPDKWVRKYVYGDWSVDALTEGAVFSEEFRKGQSFFVVPPIRTFDGIKIFEEPKDNDYQIGVDTSEAATDPCSITVVNKDTGDIAATYSAYVPINVQGDKAIALAYMYSRKTKPLIVPEANNTSGGAFIEYIKTRYGRIYEREVFSQRDNKRTKKLGFHTNYSTKTMIIEHFSKLTQKNFPRLRDKDTLDEFNVFIYTDDSTKKGAGAQNGYHDDRVMSTLLAFWDIEPLTTRETNILQRVKTQNKKPKKYQYV